MTGWCLQVVIPLLNFALGLTGGSSSAAGGVFSSRVSLISPPSTSCGVTPRPPLGLLLRFVSFQFSSGVG